MEQETVGPDTRCRVSRLSCEHAFWEFDIRNDDEFEAFIKRIARAWADAQSDKQGLHLHVNQVDAGDF